MAVYGRKKSAIKAKAVQPQSMQPQASLADVEYLMSHAIGRYHDQYLQQLALNVVKLESMQEIMKTQKKLIDNQVDLSKNKISEVVAVFSELIFDKIIEIQKSQSCIESENSKCFSDVVKIREAILRAENMLEISSAGKKYPSFVLEKNEGGTYSEDSYIKK